MCENTPMRMRAGTRDTPRDSSPGARTAGWPTTVTQGTLGGVINKFPAEEKAIQDNSWRSQKLYQMLPPLPFLPPSLFHIITGFLVLVQNLRVPRKQITVDVNLSSTATSSTFAVEISLRTDSSILTWLPTRGLNDRKWRVSADEW